MSVVEYKLVKRDDGAMGIPWWIKNGGYFKSPIDNSMIGITYEQREVKYDLPVIKPLSKSDLVSRQLAIHAVYPSTKWVDGDGNRVTDIHGRPDGLTQATMSDAEVTADVGAWYDNFVAENAPIDATQEMLDTLKKDRVNAAFAKMEELLDDAFVEVLIDSMNATLPFGCDKITQENITGINTAINAGLPVPNPTYWTPKGHITPVQVTHTELKAIGGAILDKKNEYYQQYFTHKAVIMNAVDYTAIMLY